LDLLKFKSARQRRYVMSKLNSHRAANSTIRKEEILQEPIPKTRHYNRVYTPHYTKPFYQIPFSKVSREVFIQLALTGLSGAVANPAPLIFYQILKKGLLTYKIVENYKKRNQVREMVKMYAKSEINNITEKKTSEISKEITQSAQETGLFRAISSRTFVDEKYVGLLFQNTVNQITDNKATQLTDFAVEAVL